MHARFDFAILGPFARAFALAFMLAAGQLACDAPGGGGGGVAPDGWVAPDTSGGYDTLPPAASGPPVELTQYCQRLGQVGCAAAQACGCLTQVGGNVGLCQTYIEGKCASEVTEPVAAGTFTFDAGKAGQCLAAEQSIIADCKIDEHDILLYLASHCEDFLVGARRSGEVCGSDDECVVPLSCYEDACTLLPVAGQPCLGGHTCDDHLYCDPDEVCRAHVGAGGSCAATSQACDDELYCDDRSETCAPYIASGQPCGHATYACADGSYCGGEGQTCRPYPGVGQSCSDSHGACADDLYCDDGEVCRRPGAEGASCTEDRECTSDRCTDGRCVADPSNSDACSLL